MKAAITIFVFTLLFQLVFVIEGKLLKVSHLWMGPLANESMIYPIK